MGGKVDKLEKVIKGFEHCSDRSKCNDDCPYSEIIRNANEGMDECTTQLARDALELLKEKQPKHGHWIEQEGFDSDVYYDCSVCGESWVTVEGTPEDNGMIYCPHCGAKMDEQKDGEQE